MAIAPLTYLEKRWASGYSNANNLVVGATQTTDRKQLAMLDKDTHRTISPFGRRTLLTLGRWLYWNVSAVRGAINEMADLAAQHYIAQFEGEDQEWGNMVENWLYEHDKICDVRGWPFNMTTWRKNLVRSCIVDGDMATLLTQNREGYPMIQVIPAHRIGQPSSFSSEIVQGGRYDGARIIDGVIVDSLGRPMAYRVTGENVYDNNYTDVPARDIFPSFFVEAPDQLRGISNLGASCFDWQDLRASKDFELIAQKLAASEGLLIENETGEVDRTKQLVGRDSTNYGTPSAGTQTALTTTATETVDGVKIRYHRAGTNSKVTSVRADRPTANQQAFRHDTIREALIGMGWNFDFSYDPTKAGGAQMRIVIDKINRKLDCIREELVRPAQTRVDGYRVAKVMDNPERTDKALVLFPFNEDWWRWSYQGPAELTADEKYSSDVDLQERRSGRKTLAKSAAQRGDYWKDLRAQKEMETDDLLTRATALAKKHKVSVETALTLLEDKAVYSTLTNSAAATGEATADAQSANPPTAPASAE